MDGPSATTQATYTPVQVMMELAAIAYATDVTVYLDQEKYATQGWQLAWGPARSTDQANLVYIARNTAANQFAVVVRGTYPEFGPGMLVQLFEDLDVDTPVPWTYPPVPNAAIADGTNTALGLITALTFGGVGLKDFLIAQALPSSADIYVTGHSLGGCLVTVLAPWLLAQLSAADYQGVIRPFTYAAPTAGNTAFANWFDTTFGQGAASVARRVVNPLDIIPRAWNNLLAIKALYPAPGPSCPEVVGFVVDLVAAWVADKGYDQPSRGIDELPGVATATVDFFAEALEQHGHNTYLALLEAPTLPFVVGTTRVTWNLDAITRTRMQIGMHGALPDFTRLP